MSRTITTQQVADFLSTRTGGVSGRDLVHALAHMHKCSVQEARDAVQAALDEGFVRLGNQMHIEARTLATAAA